MSGTDSRRSDTLVIDISSVTVSVLVSRATVNTGHTHGVPAVAFDDGPSVDEGLNTLVAKLVLEDHETGRFGTGEPFSHGGVNLLERRSLGSE